MPIPNAKMVSPSHLVLMFCMYKLLRFALPKIWSPQKKNVQVPSLNHSAPASSSRSFKYDVFLSFRGEDTRKTFVDHLYIALEDRQIRTYKDDQALPRGESIGPSLFEGIEDSCIAIVIFSKNYADSAWCLDELAYIMKCRDERGLIVMPVFYDVDPSEVRKLKGHFGKAFARQEAQNTTKAELWRTSLVSASNISGWEPKSIANGHEAQVIKKIVDTIFEKLFSMDSDADDDDHVGLTTRLQDMEKLLDIGSDDMVRMVGVWGVGGSGKTTLATSIFMRMSHHFQGHCIVGNVREESNKHDLKVLQENILSTICKTEVKVQSVEEGKLKIKSMLCHRKVLIFLDDVNSLDQLEALAGKHKWFGSGSRIIITTRDQHLLNTHKVDHMYPVKLLSHDEAIRLFKRHAYNEEDPIEDYETLSLSVVSYCAGLPLAIKVIGSFLYDKNRIEWMSSMDKLKDIPDVKVIDILKISFDGLETYQKELFLDIACFFRWKGTKSAMEILEACGYHPKIGIKVLIQKALITIVDDRFDMHDLVQQMGHYIVTGKYPDNPKKHSRVWEKKQLEDLPFCDETMKYDKIEALVFKYNQYDSSSFCKIVSKMKKLRLLIMKDWDFDENYEGANFLSNELRYIKWHNYPPTPFPHRFQPVKLVTLIMWESKQKELWKGYKHLPCLRVLELVRMKELLSTPNFDGLPRLQKLTLDGCLELEEIHPSLGNHTTLEYFKVYYCKMLKRIPKISQMKNIKTLLIMSCFFKDEIPCGIGEFSSLLELNLSGNSFSRLDFSLSTLTQLKSLNLFGSNQLLELPKLPSSLAILTAYGCQSLTIVEEFNKNCKELCQVTVDKYGWSDTLLQSMLKGKADENGCMNLQLKGLEIPRRFRPRLLRGRSCRLELPENWCNDFSGFLICFVYSSAFFSTYSTSISMKQEMSDMDFEDDVVWEESDGDRDMKTCVWYVSFGSLRHTTWWDQTYKSLFFNIAQSDVIMQCKGFRVGLVDKKITNGGTGLTETSTNSSSPYTPKFKIIHDSPSELIAQLVPYKS